MMALPHDHIKDFVIQNLESENAHDPKAHARKMKIDMHHAHDLTIFMRNVGGLAFRRRTKIAVKPVDA